ncbi:calcium-binding protein 39-like isoform 2 [Hibiscus syriacus]|uniref:Calcium-binding protein 39-like isoform 2 n=1 Tax=Hibiscus syriacus TaxID=106335 RepID=A0A6A3C8A8_HIBSY|nr:calcium-binding protein 39-like isoform 2 [Hibiscus syriacus]
MSFSFFKPSRPKTPTEVTKAIKDSLMALDIKTISEVKSHEKAMEEVEKNFVTMRCMLSGDGEVEPDVDQVLELALEISKEDVLSLLVHELPSLGWEARKDLVHCWSILLKQQIDSRYCCVEYIENHMELLDFLVACYDNKEIALHCGNMLRECIKFPTLAQYMLNSASFVLFFKYVELPTFDVASDSFSTFKDLLTKHGTVVSEYLTAHYDEFFDMYEKLLTSSNYVTRRQSLKLLSDFLLEPSNSNIMKRYVLEVRYLKVMMTLLKVFVANPNKPKEIKIILAKNHEKLVDLLQNLSLSLCSSVKKQLSVTGGEDEEFEEEKELIIKEIEQVSRLHNLKR